MIFGDGIHNLADGLAIGAAFADGAFLEFLHFPPLPMVLFFNSYIFMNLRFSAGAMSGFSTSVAVLCHELPHEIGSSPSTSPSFYQQCDFGG